MIVDWTPCPLDNMEVVKMIEQLAVADYKVLEQLEDAPMEINDNDIITALCDNGYVGHAANKWYITATGERTLASYKIQCEFEEWLEAEYKKAQAVNDNYGPGSYDDEIMLDMVLKKYRECKEATK